MKCKDCKLYIELKNVNGKKSGKGICFFNDYYETVSNKTKCLYEIKYKPLTCGDCEGFKSDFCCSTCKKTDNFPQQGCSMKYFKIDDEIFNFIGRLEATGIDYKKHLKKLIKSFEEAKKSFKRR